MTHDPRLKRRDELDTLHPTKGWRWPDRREVAEHKAFLARIAGQKRPRNRRAKTTGGAK